MKTAISVPDSLFDATEELARRLHISRSELYARAAAEFVRIHRERDVTPRLDRIYGQSASGTDSVLSRLQEASIPREEW